MASTKNHRKSYENPSTVLRFRHPDTVNLTIRSPPPKNPFKGQKVIGIIPNSPPQSNCFERFSFRKNRKMHWGGHSFPDFPDIPDIPDLPLPRLSEREGLSENVLRHDLRRIGLAFFRKDGEGEIADFLPCAGRIDFKARKRLDVNGTDAGV